MAMWIYDFMSELFRRKGDNLSETTDEDFERFIERINERISRNSPVNEVTEQIAAIRAHWTTLTQEEKNKFLKKCTESEAGKWKACRLIYLLGCLIRAPILHVLAPVGAVTGGACAPIQKATDDDLRNASKFIPTSNMSKLATNI